MADERRIIAYELSENGMLPLTTAPVERDWMDQSPQRYAYRCLPLAIANRAGWLLHNPVTFTAVWDGGPTRHNVRLEIETPGMQAPSSPWAFTVDSTTISARASVRDPRVTEHFGVGTVTFTISYLFRTPPGINLWVKGPSNWIKDGAQPLEGIVETDWVPSTFTMNWKLTRPHFPVRFEKDEPVCMIVPVLRGLAESLTPVRMPIERDPALWKEYQESVNSRVDFLRALESREPEAVERGWQRDYMHGVTAGGARAPEHQTRLNLKEFVRE
ncbi:MAG TPA: DUF6065 family protein [Gemmataceae bacterium]|jgi:hypothetical protein|nr:DUF6065 family protein [Gemmataceae bacterium]